MEVVNPVEAERAAASAANASASPTPLLRNACLDDAAAIARILAEAFPALYHSTFGKRNTAETAALLQSLYEFGHLSLEDTRVCEFDGAVAAVMILHTGRSIGRGSAVSYWNLLRSRFGLLHSPRMFVGGIMANLMLDRRIPRSTDLVYIEALAVSEPHRGRGLGSRLLADAERWALSRGRSRLALHVLTGNTGARRLYERTGFRPWFEQSSEPRWHAHIPAPSWAAILMARSLDRPGSES